MMKSYLHIVFLSILFTSCNQEEILVVTNYDEDRLVIDGFLTAESEIQTFKVDLANNIGDSTTQAVSNVSFSVSSASEYIPFNLQNGNTLVSQFAFQAYPDTIYTLDYCYDGVCGKKEFTVPHQVSIDSAFPNQLTLINSSIKSELGIHLTSSYDQWARLEAYKLDSVNMTGDSIWTLQQHPIYDVIQVTASSNSLYIVENFVPGKDGQADSIDVKIICYALSSETGQYLYDLNNFMTGEFTGSQYQNPPNYFDDGTLGLFYGTVLDSIYISY